VIFPLPQELSSIGEQDYGSRVDHIYDDVYILDKAYLITLGSLESSIKINGKRIELWVWVKLSQESVMSNIEHVNFNFSCDGEIASSLPEVPFMGSKVNVTFDREVPNLTYPRIRLTDPRSLMQRWLNGEKVDSNTLSHLLKMNEY
jgi:hypothetical protein